VPLKTGHLAVRTILPSWFDLPEETFSYKEVQFRHFCPPTENGNETLGYIPVGQVNF